MSGFATKWIRFTLNGTNPGHFQNVLKSDLEKSRICEPNVLKSDLKKSRICPIWGQSDPLLSQTYHPCYMVSRFASLAAVPPTVVLLVMLHLSLTALATSCYCYSQAETGKYRLPYYVDCFFLI